MDIIQGIADFIDMTVNVVVYLWRIVFVLISLFLFFVFAAIQGGKKWL